MWLSNNLRLDIQKQYFSPQPIEKYAYIFNCETFCHTATLLIHIQKYLSLVSGCFTKEKNKGTV